MTNQQKILRYFRNTKTISEENQEIFIVKPIFLSRVKIKFSDSFYNKISEIGEINSLRRVEQASSDYLPQLTDIKLLSQKFYNDISNENFKRYLNSRKKNLLNVEDLLNKLLIKVETEPIKGKIIFWDRKEIEELLFYLIMKRTEYLRTIYNNNEFIEVLNQYNYHTFFSSTLIQRQELVINKLSQLKTTAGNMIQRINNQIQTTIDFINNKSTEIRNMRNNWSNSLGTEAARINSFFYEKNISASLDVEWEINQQTINVSVVEQKIRTLREKIEVLTNRLERKLKALEEESDNLSYESIEDKIRKCILKLGSYMNWSFRTNVSFETIARKIYAE